MMKSLLGESLSEEQIAHVVAKASKSVIISNPRDKNLQGTQSWSTNGLIRLFFAL